MTTYLLTWNPERWLQRSNFIRRA